jgi:hypothetical protein
VSDVALACDISEDRLHAAVCAAGREPGIGLLAVLAWYDHPRGAVRVLADLWLERNPVSVVVDGRSQSATLLGPLEDAGVPVVQPTPSEVAVAHGQFLDLVRGRQLAHYDQLELTNAVRAAEHRPLAGSLAVDRRGPVDESPLRAAELAVWAFLAWEAGATAGCWII